MGSGEERFRSGRHRGDIEGLLKIRKRSEQLAAPLGVEDQLVQSMPDVSPTKWHLGHTTWFFETFVLRKFHPKYQPVHPQYEVLFNSYYNSVGEQHPRSRRGMLSRPTLAEVQDYRRFVDEALAELAGGPLVGDAEELAAMIELGGQHEQQHQELMLTDIKHVLYQNPLRPAYLSLDGGQESERPPADLSFGPARVESEDEWWFVEGGETVVGASESEFHFDNEGPRHRVLLGSFELSANALSNRAVLEFIEAGGYQNPLLWLSEGWAWVQSQQVQMPLYFERGPHGFQVFSHRGIEDLPLDEVACHLSYFEADALARFLGRRLVTEFEWETAKRRLGESTFRASGVWEWTGSSYLAYPGFRPAPGAVGEYNGKFMHNQMVLRGGSWATPPGHVRPSYRNFFPGTAAWQFSGVRLARDR